MFYKIFDSGGKMAKSGKVLEGDGEGVFHIPKSKCQLSGGVQSKTDKSVRARKYVAA